MIGYEFIRATRKEQGLSLRAVAEKAGLSHVFVMQVEKGDSEISYDKLIRLLHALNVSMFQFLRAVEYKKPLKVSSENWRERMGIEPILPAFGKQHRI